uniref:Uncharacterized protein n=1 Tax=Anopheles dirus TaxID=7168 RepID=A0A182NTP1_9DIPT
MKYLVLCTIIAGAAAAYSSSSYRDGKATGLYNQVSVGTDYADKFPHGNTGYTGGYQTHYAGPNGAGVAVGAGTGSFAPGFGGYPGPTVDFNNFFNGIQANFANLYQQQFALQQALFQQQQAAFAPFAGGFGGAAAGAGFGSVPVYGPNFAGGSNYVSSTRYPTGNYGSPNVASSSASFGPGGFHQTASIYPNNPGVPNVDTRFGGSEQSTGFQGGKPGFVGVSSFSSSSNINGQTHREAVTSVNDNGKITTHRVHSPPVSAPCKESLPSGCPAGLIRSKNVLSIPVYQSNMWQRAVWITLLVGYCSAGVATWSEDISVHNNAAVTGIHYSQHESSVNAARKAAADRLQQNQAASLVAAGGGSGGPCETLCYNSFTADGASDTETIGQGIVGFTSPGAGSAVGSSQKYSATSSRMSESSMQNVHGAPVIYPAVGGSSSGTRSSYTSSSSSRQQQLHSSGSAQPVSNALYGASDYGRSQTGFVQPVIYNVQGPQTHAAHSSFNERSSNERSVVGGRPIVANVVYTPVPVAGSSSNSFNTRSSFASTANEQQVVQPVLYPATNSDYSRRYVVHQDNQYRSNPSNTYVLYSKPVQYYAPARSRTDGSTSYDATGRVLNVNVVQPVHTERVDEQRTEQRAESVQTVQRQPDVFPARGSFDQQEHEHEQQQYVDELDGVSTEPSVVPGAGSSSSSQRRAEQQSSSSYVRTGSYVPSAGANNRYSTSQSADSQRRQTYHSAGPGFVAPVPVGGVSSSKYESASEQHQQHQQRQHVPIIVQPVPVGSSSTATRYTSSAHEQRSNTHGSGTGGSAYYSVPAGSAAYGSQHSNTASSSSHSSRHKAGAGGSFVHYPITNDEYGRRFGGGAGGYGADTDLHDIMSESESLARLQAQNVHNGAVAGSGTFDTESRFGGTSESEAGLGTMPGGFQRTKSWSSSSKWASEQRYGDDGKPKTYSMLSTAESEKHNVNGKTTGYKAATTTLEDDGKVSTYTPLLDWGKQDGGGLIGKVSTLKQTVYEKKRELLNGLNEKVSKMLWIPPYPSTTEEAPVNAAPQQDPMSEAPSIWWWQTTELPPSSRTQPTVMVTSTVRRTTERPSNDDRLVFTVADTDELEQPNVFIPTDVLVTEG